MKKKLVSIIVPIYNVDKYLKKCIDSIIEQTYRDLEIILIDDGSTDECGNICDKYSFLDKRVKVIHKKHAGVAEARNDGVKLSTGEYIMFVDSDDYVDLDIVEFLYNSINNSKNIDIATCMYKNVYSINGVDKLENTRNKNKLFLYNKEEALEDFLYTKNNFVNVFAKLYKRELFNGITFPKGKICEDLAVSYKIFAKAKKVVINTVAKYYYYQREDSIMHSKFTKDRMEGLNFALEQTEFIKKKFPSLDKAAINREFMEGIYIALNMPFTKEFIDDFNKVKEIIRKNRKIVLFDNKAGLISRIYALFSYIGIKNMVRFHKLYSKIRGV